MAINPRRVVLLVCFLMICPPSPADDSGEAGAVVSRFYNKYLELRWSGLPSAEIQKTLSPYLSKTLQQLLNDALRYVRQYKKEHPGEKPPLIDGCLFASLFEGPKAFAIADVTATPGGEWRVTVAFSYDDERWRDIALVKREGERYVIDDVLLSGAGPFNPPGRLTETLKWRENAE